MRQRCYNSNDEDYPNYGARGVTVCERWSSYAAFEADMEPRPVGYTLDRIDVNGNYEPDNCRWADSQTQRLNQRRQEDGKRMAKEIRAFYAGGLTQQIIAGMYGLRQSSISRIVRGLRWA